MSKGEKGLFMKKYIIVAESGADLSREMIEKHDIRVAQMHVEIDGRDYLDEAVSMQELTAYYEKTGKVPKTSGVNPNQYADVFRKIKEEDPGAIIIHICYSAQLSCGYQSSILADDPALAIYRIDAKNVSIGHGFIIMKTVELIKRQPDIEPEDLVAQINAFVEKTRFSFVPGNLDYLRAGGRVSNAQYLGATLFQLKPLIEVIDGLMLSTKKYRGSLGKILPLALSEYFERFPIDKTEMFCVYACTIDKAIKEAIDRQARLAGVRSILWLETGGVIASHSGPGGVGFAGMEI